ncbi:unnamed protein product [Periconia digitata]|uniref:Uncharacterized protein n=1 Tax=Periconia digitata TaxID=1303443 RepID=A0A9W4U761_9PLEO|nr:unnamed protein product [Periconia digitata]
MWVVEVALGRVQVRALLAAMPPLGIILHVAAARRAVLLQTCLIYLPSWLAFNTSRILYFPFSLCLCLVRLRACGENIFSRSKIFTRDDDLAPGTNEGSHKQKGMIPVITTIQNRCFFPAPSAQASHHFVVQCS